MAKKNARNTRGRIVEAAWRLFYDQGYEDTTVEEIIESSQTSKGSFYHYFDGKDALLSTLSDLFDQKYQDLQAVMPPEMPTMEKLLFLNRELFRMIEDSVSIDLMARLLSTQLVTTGNRHLLDHTVEGVKQEEKQVLGVQHYPENMPGADDCVYVYDDFVQMMAKNSEGGNHNA